MVQAPLRESAHRVVIEVHLAEGNMAEALRQFGVLESRLWHELRVWPSRELQDLIAFPRSGASAPVGAGAP